MKNPAILERAEFVCTHAQIDRVVRQKISGRGLKDGEGATADKQDSRENQQRPAIADGCLQEAAIVVCQKKTLTLTLVLRRSTARPPNRRRS
jgi:hypothetical protein